MANETLAAIEDGVLELLAPLKATEPGGYVRTLKSYAGDFTVALEQIAVQPPAILVALSRAWHLPELQTERIRFAIIAADSAIRAPGEAGRRAGPTDSRVVGTYRMLRDVRTCLDKVRPLPDVAPLLWESDELLVLSPQWSIYVAHYTTDPTYEP